MKSELKCKPHRQSPAFSQRYWQASQVLPAGRNLAAGLHHPAGKRAIWKPTRYPVAGEGRGLVTALSCLTQTWEALSGGK